MAVIKPFAPVKLVCGIIAGPDEPFAAAEDRLAAAYGPIDDRSPRAAFPGADYYASRMGPGLRRGFLSFAGLIDPTALPAIKVETNDLEAELSGTMGTEARIVNLDPGYLTAAALIMATAKDFSHRVPLGRGIYAHLEFLFTKNGIRTLEWTYPDFRGEAYGDFFPRVRRRYLSQLHTETGPLNGAGAPPGGG
ncbi:MAG: DUF4416 family protein [Candidatus Aminicenantales bacterium]